MDLVKVCMDLQLEGRTVIGKLARRTLAYRSHNFVHHDDDLPISPSPPHLPSTVEYNGIMMTPHLHIPPPSSSISRTTSLGHHLLAILSTNYQLVDTKAIR